MPNGTSTTPQEPNKPETNTEKKVEEVNPPEETKPKVTINEKTHVILVGNPGCGKSTILNTLLDRVEFKGGLSFGAGMTRILKTVEDGTSRFSDTPGLDDPSLAKRAAQEISSALSIEGEIKLVFVSMLHEGRVLPSDLATISIVLDGIEAVGVNPNNRFSIIVNKCSPLEVEALKNVDVLAGVHELFEGKRKLSNLLIAEAFEDARGKSDQILPNRSELVKFINDSPKMDMPGTAVEVSVDKYPEAIQALALRLGQLQENLQQMEEIRRKDQETLRKLEDLRIKNENTLLELHEKSNQDRESHTRDMEEMAKRNEEEILKLQASSERDRAHIRDLEARPKCSIC